MSQTERGTKKYIDFTETEIKEYLFHFKRLVKSGFYTIAVNENREENISFIEQYKINSHKEKEILLSLEHLDFCYAVDNKKIQFAHEKLYVFCKLYELDNWGSLETVDIYIKTNLTQTRSGNDYLVVISFHKRNKPLKHLFKE